MKFYIIFAILAAIVAVRSKPRVQEYEGISDESIKKINKAVIDPTKTKENSADNAEATKEPETNVDDNTDGEHQKYVNDEKSKLTKHSEPDSHKTDQTKEKKHKHHHHYHHKNNKEHDHGIKNDHKNHNNTHEDNNTKKDKKVKKNVVVTRKVEKVKGANGTDIEKIVITKVITKEIDKDVKQHKNKHGGKDEKNVDVNKHKKVKKVITKVIEKDITDNNGTENEERNIHVKKTITKDIEKEKDFEDTENEGEGNNTFSTDVKKKVKKDIVISKTIEKDIHKTKSHGEETKAVKKTVNTSKSVQKTKETDKTKKQNGKSTVEHIKDHSEEYIKTSDEMKKNTKKHKTHNEVHNNVAYDDNKVSKHKSNDTKATNAHRIKKDNKQSQTQKQAQEIARSGAEIVETSKASAIEVEKTKLQIAKQVISTAAVQAKRSRETVTSDGDGKQKVKRSQKQAQRIASTGHQVVQTSKETAMGLEKTKLQIAKQVISTAAVQAKRSKETVTSDGDGEQKVKRSQEQAQRIASTGHQVVLTSKETAMGLEKTKLQIAKQVISTAAVQAKRSKETVTSDGDGEQKVKRSQEQAQRIASTGHQVVQTSKETAMGLEKTKLQIAKQVISTAAVQAKRSKETVTSDGDGEQKVKRSQEQAQRIASTGHQVVLTSKETAMGLEKTKLQIAKQVISTAAVQAKRSRETVTSDGDGEQKVKRSQEQAQRIASTGHQVVLTSKETAMGLEKTKLQIAKQVISTASDQTKKSKETAIGDHEKVTSETEEKKQQETSQEKDKSTKNSEKTGTDGSKVLHWDTCCCT